MPHIIDIPLFNINISYSKFLYHDWWFENVGHILLMSQGCAVLYVVWSDSLPTKNLSDVQAVLPTYLILRYIFSEYVVQQIFQKMCVCMKSCRRSVFKLLLRFWPKVCLFMSLEKNGVISRNYWRFCFVSPKPFQWSENCFVIVQVPPQRRAVFKNEQLENERGNNF